MFRKRRKRFDGEIYNLIRMHVTNRLNLEGVQKVKWYGGQKVKEEPAPHVVDGNQSWFVHNLTALVHVSCSEVQHDVCR